MPVQMTPKPTARAQGTISIKAESNDPGIKLKVDPAKDTVTVKGTVGGAFVKDDSNHAVDYALSRDVSLSFDRDKMPNFDAEPDDSKKNAWYFSHMVSLAKGLGTAAAEVAKAMAAAVNKGNIYKASVTEKSPQEATITFTRR